MKLRLFLPIALIAIAALVGGSCSSDDGGDSAARTSEDRDSSGDSGSSDSGSGDSGSSDSDSGDSGSDVPDLGDIAGSIPGMDDLEGCLDLATTYSSLYLEALGGESGAREAQQKAEDLKDQMPSELHDDIDVIAEAIGKVADEGLLSGTEALDTPEYQAADEAVTNYFQQECGG